MKKNVAFVIEIKSAHRKHFQQKTQRRLLRNISKQLSRGFPAQGFYHSHNTQKKGSKFSPHIHMIVELPEEKVTEFFDGLHADLALKDKTGYFALSDKEHWKRDTDIKYLEYCLGPYRNHLPEIIYQKSITQNRIRETANQKV